MKGHPYEHGFDLKLVPQKLTEPFSWRSPKLVFVNSMSDLFQDRVSDDYIEAVCRVMVAARWHTFQVLTKRSARLRELLSGHLRFAAQQEHIWASVSKIGNMACRELLICRQRLLASAFSQLSRCLKTWGKSTSPALAGQLLVARAGRALGRCSRSGLLPSRPVSRIASAVLLQTVGRREKG